MPIEELEEALKSRQEEMQKLKDQIVDSFKKGITPYFKEVFERFPIVEKIEWTQYTPYFNDGDTCEFGFYGINIHFYKDAFTENRNNIFEENDDGSYFLPGWYLESLSLAEKLKNSKLDSIITKEFISEFTKLDALLNSCEEELKYVWGDHTKVEVTKDAIETSEYDHE